mmetsp:Transcript_258/g.494  ORF Transcript_258/g.494 Transcript_258/m.494 type:complete len:256 (-) Transcript_258:116-883(-)
MSSTNSRSRRVLASSLTILRSLELYTVFNLCEGALILVISEGICTSATRPSSKGMADFVPCPPVPCTSSDFALRFSSSSLAWASLCLIMYAMICSSDMRDICAWVRIGMGSSLGLGGGVQGMWPLHISVGITSLTLGPSLSSSLTYVILMWQVSPGRRLPMWQTNELVSVFSFSRRAAPCLFATALSYVFFCLCSALNDSLYCFACYFGFESTHSSIALKGKNVLDLQGFLAMICELLVQNDPRTKVDNFHFGLD